MAEGNPSLEILDDWNSDSTLWDHFVEKSPQGTFFHTTTWANVLSSTFGRTYDIIFCIKNEQPVAGMIFFKHKKLIWNMITPTAFFPYCAPIFYRPVDEKPQKTIHNQLTITARFDDYLRENYDYWILDVPSSSKDVRSYLWKGATIEPQYSYVVSVKNRDELYDNYNQSVRKKLKQAQDKNAKIIESRDPRHLADLVIKSYQRHGMNPHVSEKHLNIFLNKVMELNKAKLYYLELKGIITAGRLVIIDSSFGYDLLAGSDDQNGFGSTYLIASILEKYAGEIERFDFLGANHPQIEQFKRGFGGELIQGFRVTNKTKIPLSWIIKFHRYQMQKDRVL
jgi:lipid II:glycine glycyltransferase (peptidoglycan interpeptide bridge formation enzyme)